MKKQIILNVDSNDNLVDDNSNVIVSSFSAMSYSYKTLDDIKNKESIDVAKLVSLGVTPDDLIKLKANKIL